ncbi:pantetheine-phosphate adenylyltransferase [Anoxynatronum sibiricum]|uniref:Phosphopantetheine adenylyltransferase n=1 Tax=Anoxynatronum sibiricum TaxID=210623 RepID=A0ABU9VQM4_9CLOT
MIRALYPGSFDPITNGHLDIIERASRLCDEVLVTVLPNTSKSPLFSIEERVAMIEEVVAPFHNVSVKMHAGLLVDFADEQNAQVIIKGLRAVSDFEYEFQMALMNRKLNQKVETMFLMTQSQNSFLSSSLVKEVARLNGCIKGLVPETVERVIRHKFRSGLTDDREG